MRLQLSHRPAMSLTRHSNQLVLCQDREWAWKVDSPVWWLLIRKDCQLRVANFLWAFQRCATKGILNPWPCLIRVLTIQRLPNESSFIVMMMRDKMWWKRSTSSRLTISAFWPSKDQAMLQCPKYLLNRWPALPRILSPRKISHQSRRHSNNRNLAEPVWRIVTDLPNVLEYNALTSNLLHIKLVMIYLLQISKTKNKH